MAGRLQPVTRGGYGADGLYGFRATGGAAAGGAGGASKWNGGSKGGSNGAVEQADYTAQVDQAHERQRHRFCRWHGSWRWYAHNRVFLTMTLTIEILPEEELRVTEAFGSILNLKDENGNARPANQTDLQGACSSWMGNQTHDYERRKNQQQFVPPPLTLNEPVELPPPEPG
jgi:hypothetical protein